MKVNLDVPRFSAAPCSSKVDVPVIGIGEAAFHASSMIATKFSVVTALARSVAGIEANLNRYGLNARCVKVRATDIPVMKLEEADVATTDKSANYRVVMTSFLASI